MTGPRKGRNATGHTSCKGPAKAIGVVICESPFSGIWADPQGCEVSKAAVLSFFEHLEEFMKYLQFADEFMLTYKSTEIINQLVVDILGNWIHSNLNQDSLHDGYTPGCLHLGTCWPPFGITAFVAEALLPVLPGGIGDGKPELGDQKSRKTEQKEIGWLFLLMYFWA